MEARATQEAAGTHDLLEVTPQGSSVRVTIEPDNSVAIRFGDSGLQMTWKQSQQLGQLLMQTGRIARRREEGARRSR